MLRQIIEAKPTIQYVAFVFQNGPKLQPSLAVNATEP